MKYKDIPLLRGNRYRQNYFKETRNNDQNHPEDDLMHFDIFCRNQYMQEIKPHRLAYYKIYLITEGEGHYTIGGESVHVGKNTLGFSGPDMISSWQALSTEQYGYTSTFSDHYFNVGRTDKDLLKFLPLFQINQRALFNLTEEETSSLLSVFKQMYDAHHNNLKYKDEMIRSLLEFLIHKGSALLENEKPKAVRHYDNASKKLLNDFTKLYMNDFEKIKYGTPLQIKKIKAYADELGISQNHLNDVVKHHTGKSAGQLIKDQIIVQAMMCLKQSDKSVSEIAYLLNFEDPSYFTRFFKSKTGITPKGIRSI